MGSKISVIIPVLNRAALLSRCLQSILEAGYENLEVLVIDDGSQDASLEIIKKYEAQYPDIVRALTHPRQENRGVSASRNLGILAASGDYVCFLDSDDVMLPGRFYYAAKILDTYPEIDGVYETVETCSEHNER